MPEEMRLDPEQWVDAYGDYLFRYAVSRLRDASAAEEVVQETFLAGIRAREQYSGAGSERGWLLGILKRKIVDYIRARAKHDPRDEEPGDPVDRLFDAGGNWIERAARWSRLPEDEIASQELWQVVKQCLGHLPKGQADVFVLSVLEEMDSQDVCRLLSISPSNLWVRLHRARLRLAECVGSKWFIDEEVPTHAE